VTETRGAFILRATRDRIGGSARTRYLVAVPAGSVLASNDADILPGHSDSLRGRTRNECARLGKVSPSRSRSPWWAQSEVSIPGCPADVPAPWPPRHDDRDSLVTLARKTLGGSVLGTVFVFRSKAGPNADDRRSPAPLKAPAGKKHRCTSAKRPTKCLSSARPCVVPQGPHTQCPLLHCESRGRTMRRPDHQGREQKDFHTHHSRVTLSPGLTNDAPKQGCEAAVTLDWRT